MKSARRKSVYFGEPLQRFVDTRLRADQSLSHELNALVSQWLEIIEQQRLPAIAPDVLNRAGENLDGVPTPKLSALPAFFSGCGMGELAAVIEPLNAAQRAAVLDAIQRHRRAQESAAKRKP